MAAEIKVPKAEAPEKAPKETPAKGPKRDEGPKVGAKGEYLPATYRHPKGFIREDR